MTHNTNPDLGWVRVTDAMPDDDTEVIVITTDKNQWFAYRDADEWKDQMGNPFPLWPSIVTHWRNPFEPPKEGE